MGLSHRLSLFIDVRYAVTAPHQQVPVDTLNAPRGSRECWVFVHGELEADEKATSVEEFAHSSGPVPAHAGMESAEELPELGEDITSKAERSKTEGKVLIHRVVVDKIKLFRICRGGCFTFPVGVEEIAFNELCLTSVPV